MRTGMIEEITTHFDSLIASLCLQFNQPVIDWFVQALGMQIAMLRDLESQRTTCEQLEDLLRLDIDFTESLTPNEGRMLVEIAVKYRTLDFVDMCYFSY